MSDSVPIVMVSGIDRTQPALAAGADRFLLYDEWLRIGTMVQELLAERQTHSGFVAHVDLIRGTTEKNEFRAERGG